ncbi:glycosyltransferase family 2 protein [Xanthomonas massiliensis]|uniref:glycosyltransferase family 2 protein n=1 Tax=Xanthomonas massiliensis TaxID=1720302 RepID=UPI00082506BD|nr:glycosyltransferase family 2 protein [Xanthomonas massiliensis]
MSRPILADQAAIVIPALNESLRIREVVQAARAQCPHVIVVDDGSDDGTLERIADLAVVRLRHPRRLGKGAALRTGFAEAARLGLRGVMTMDGDGQHDAADFPRLLAAANRHPGAIVIGARLRQRACQPWLRRLGNAFGDWGIAWGCGYRLVDSQSGQRFYPRAVFTLPGVPGEGFVYEAQLLIAAARRLGSGVVAVPIVTRYPGDGHGAMRPSHFRLLRDLWRITSQVTAEVLAHGHLAATWRSVRASRVVVDGGAETASRPPVPDASATPLHPGKEA